MLPKLCHVCQRIAVEQDIAEKTVKALFAAGYTLAIDNGEGVSETFVYRAEIGLQPSVDRVLAAMFETDDEYLLATSVNTDQGDGWVRFVYGNGGYDVISDYTINLEDVLKPVNDYANTLEC